MEAPEYYEHIRLRDVFQRDVVAVDTMLDTLKAQKRLLTHVLAREETYKALFSLDSTIGSLERLKDQIQGEVDDHTVQATAGRYDHA